jgi:hypothetical protein
MTTGRGPTLIPARTSGNSLVVPTAVCRPNLDSLAVRISLLRKLLVVGFGLAAIGGITGVPAHAEVTNATTSGTLDVRAQTDARHLVIKVNTLGGPPVATKSQPIWLVNDQGLNKSSAWVLDPYSSPCQGAPIHFVPVGPAPYTANQNWCLDLNLPQYGSQVTGVLHGASATIGISVEHQAGWGWPILCAALGLLLALFVVLMSSANIPNLAPSLSPGVRLRRIVRKAKKQNVRDLTNDWRREAIKAARSSVAGAKSHRAVGYLADVMERANDRQDRQALWEAVGDLPDDSDLYPVAEKPQISPSEESTKPPPPAESQPPNRRSRLAQSAWR